ncbi:DUF309 domain-containing protein [Bacillus shivajii]|uniref:DUF309 domain-containing protein n=1 Tax=Bacillus shivajii TaxID=1983719 RepID=UPI001CFACC4C|nr:DUF309 domain-containing protein [Bacillus shivajii]UCZ54708.1 DUF309 domain-containing protein [Bacillus shivajii]
MSYYPKAYIEYLLHFHGTRDYFECHEVMEEYWKEYGGKKWLTLIQLAVAVYHERQNNQKGSLRLYEKTRYQLTNDPKLFESIGIDPKVLAEIVTNRIQRVRVNGPYQPLNIPITDDELIRLCKQQCSQKGYRWCGIENMDNKNLIYKHKLRDRSEVIQEREDALERKLKARKS